MAKGPRAGRRGARVGRSGRGGTRRASAGGGAGIPAERQKRLFEEPRKTPVIETESGVRVRLEGSRETLDRSMNHLIGRTMTPEQVAALTGVQPGYTARVVPTGDSVAVYVTGTANGVSVRAERHFRRNSAGQPVVYNAFFTAEDSSGRTGSGIGLKMFGTQVKNMRAAGFKSIGVTAAGSYGQSFNGYYTWARFGYDGPLSPGYTARAAEAGFTAPGGGAPRRVSDLMRTAAGRDWWKRNGSSMHMDFDLNKNSLSSRVLAAYVKERAKGGSTRTRRRGRD